MRIPPLYLDSFKKGPALSYETGRASPSKRGERRKMIAEISKAMAKAAAEICEEKKGREISIIDISEISVIADYFVIVTAENSRQVEALSDSLQDGMAKRGYGIRRAEGKPDSGWILLDFNDIIIHVFDKEQRFFYDLERIWSDGKKIVNPKEL